MNNQQFRRLLVDNSSSPPGSKDASSTPRAAPGATPLLGSRARSSIPMTPRNVGSSASELFRQQLREQQDAKNPQGRKFRSAAAPKGYKLAAGYTDRAQLRNEDGPEDDKEARVRALEEMVKLGQMEFADFETARDQIVGGDVRSAHLIKGLDRKLLARARAGEDVFSTPAEEQPNDEVEDENVDEKLDDLENDIEVAPIQREERIKKGTMAAPPLPITGRKRTRDDILRELKEARIRAAEEKKAAMQPALGAHFKKIGPKNVPGTSRVEIDELGREVLIVVDAQGNVKRKVKKQKKDTVATAPAMPMPDKDSKPLGMEVPENLKATPVVEESDDIFSDAGSDYNPLGNLGNDYSDSDSKDGSEEGQMEEESAQKTDTVNRTSSAGPADTLDTLAKQDSSKPRNYFGTDMESSAGSGKSFDPKRDPSIMDALIRASASKAAETSSGQTEEATTEKARLARLRARLAEQDRDADDMDAGFGTSRFDDQDDGEERPVKLAKWKGLGPLGDDDEQDGEHKRKDEKGPRKRGPKKKKGDKNDASTVLSVMERQKA